MQKTKSAAAQATDERPIAPPYLRQISVHPAFSSSGQKHDSHWVLNPGCMMDVVTPLTPGCPQSTTACCSVWEDLSGNAAILIVC